MRFKKLNESNKTVTIGNRQYEIRYTKPTASEMASYSNENGLEYLGAVKYRGKVYDRYDNGFDNLSKGILVPRTSSDAASELARNLFIDLYDVNWEEFYASRDEGVKDMENAVKYHREVLIDLIKQDEDLSDEQKDDSIGQLSSLEVY